MIDTEVLIKKTLNLKESEKKIFNDKFLLK